MKMPETPSWVTSDVLRTTCTGIRSEEIDTILDALYGQSLTKEQIIHAFANVFFYVAPIAWVDLQNAYEWFNTQEELKRPSKITAQKLIRLVDKIFNLREKNKMGGYIVSDVSTKERYSKTGLKLSHPIPGLRLAGLYTRIFNSGLDDNMRIQKDPTNPRYVLMSKVGSNSNELPNTLIFDNETGQIVPPEIPAAGWNVITLNCYIKEDTLNTFFKNIKFSHITSKDELDQLVSKLLLGEIDSSKTVLIIRDGINARSLGITKINMKRLSKLGIHIIKAELIEPKILATHKDKGKRNFMYDQIRTIILDEK